MADERFDGGPTTEEERRAFWTRDAVHFPRALSPMGASIMPALEYDGLAAAREELALPVTLVARVFDGYAYSAAFPYSTDPEMQAARVALHRRTIEAAIDALPGRWRDEFQPELERRNAALLAVDPVTLGATALADYLDHVLAELHRSWTIHFLVVLPVFAAGGALAEAYRAATGDETTDAPYRLMLGEENATLAADRAVYAVAEQARTRPALAEALLARRVASIAALRAVPGGDVIADAVEALLARYGHRVSAADDLTDPSWIERPALLLDLLRQYLAGALIDPGERQRTALAERAAIEARALAACRDEAMRDRLRRAIARARAVWPLRETHALYIDQMTLSLLRRPLLAAGDLLVRAGRLNRRDDVLLLTRADLDAGLRDDRIDLRAAAAAGGARWRRQQATEPPPWLGTPPGPDAPPPDPELLKAFGAPVEQGADRVLRGHAGSGGRAIGRARLVFGPDDFERVEPGDVLVCPVTTPAWTPLFPIVAGLVADAGGALSHGAIVAREYGLPAVVGVGVATRRLRDGQRVEVDGDAGLVRLLD